MNRPRDRIRDGIPFDSNINRSTNRLLFTRNSPTTPTTKWRRERNIPSIIAIASVTIQVITGLTIPYVEIDRASNKRLTFELNDRVFSIGREAIRERVYITVRITKNRPRDHIIVSVG
jgi:hypothetical protein